VQQSEPADGGPVRQALETIRTEYGPLFAPRNVAVRRNGDGSFGLVRPADTSGDFDRGSARNRTASGEGLADEARRARTRRNPRGIVRPRRIEDAANARAGRGELDQK
jgi:hypothetical protein